MLSDRSPDTLSPRPYPRKPRRFDQFVKLPIGVRARLRASARVLDLEISELTEVAITTYLDALDRGRRAQGLSPLPDAEGAPPQE